MLANFPAKGMTGDTEALELAHRVRLRWCGPEVEIEGIVSLKTGGCPEDCHFCSQSGRFETTVRATRLDIPALVEAARPTAESGATEFCIVAAARGPDARLMAEAQAGIAAIREEVEINIACSLGILTAQASGRAWRPPLHHNLETARSTSSILGPAPRWPATRLLGWHAALRAVTAFRLALPRTVLRFAGGREPTLGDLGARRGMLGGANALIVGNYLTTLGREPAQDLAMLRQLDLPLKP
jgi:biotin synthase